MLGFHLAHGKGVPEENVKAHAWFNLAAAQGNTKATEGKDSLRKRMTVEPIAKGQRLSRELYNRIESSTSQ